MNVIRNATFSDGVCVEEQVIDLAAGTVTIEVDDESVETRLLTPDEVAVFAPRAVSADDRLAALEAQNAELLAALSKATSLAQIRAAAADLA